MTVRVRERRVRDRPRQQWQRSF